MLKAYNSPEWSATMYVNIARIKKDDNEYE